MSASTPSDTAVVRQHSRAITSVTAGFQHIVEILHLLCKQLGAIARPAISMLFLVVTVCTKLSHNESQQFVPRTHRRPSSIRLTNSMYIPQCLVCSF